MGIEHGEPSRGLPPLGRRSVAVQRALADFGAEESFGQAAKRNERALRVDHRRSGVRREVEKTEREAEQYVETRLLEARLNYEKPLEKRPGQEQVVVELDGCHIRTGKKILLEGAELTKKRLARRMTSESLL